MLHKPLHTHPTLEGRESLHARVPGGRRRLSHPRTDAARGSPVWIGLADRDRERLVEIQASREQTVPHA